MCFLWTSVFVVTMLLNVPFIGKIYHIIKSKYIFPVCFIHTNVAFVEYSPYQSNSWLFQTHLLSVKANSVCWIFLNCTTSTDSWKRSDSKEREVHGSALAVWQRTVRLWQVSHTLPSRGPSATETNPNWAVSSPTPTPEPPSSPGGRSGSSPCRSLSRVSCGTLHPHPFRSEKAVSRKPRSRPCSSGFNAWYPAG